MTPNNLGAADAGALLARLDQDRAREAVLLAENKTALFDSLASTPIATILVEFDGGGDSGQIESIAAWDAEGRTVEFPAGAISLRLPDGVGGERLSDQSLSAAVETLAYDCLALSHSGWENNDGGFGTFTFVVSNRSIRLEMNERVTQALHSEHEF